MGFISHLYFSFVQETLRFLSNKSLTRVCNSFIFCFITFLLSDITSIFLLPCSVWGTSFSTKICLPLPCPLPSCPIPACHLEFSFCSERKFDILLYALSATSSKNLMSVLTLSKSSLTEITHSVGPKDIKPCSTNATPTMKTIDGDFYTIQYMKHL